MLLNLCKDLAQAEVNYPEVPGMELDYLGGGYPESEDFGTVDFVVVVPEVVNPEFADHFRYGHILCHKVLSGVYKHHSLRWHLKVLFLTNYIVLIRVDC